MRVAFFQYSPYFGNPEKNLDLIRINISKANSIDILVLPELALTGYTFKDYEEAYSLGEEIGGKLCKELISVAGENSLVIAVGFLEREGKNLYNSVVLVDGKGILGIYRKIHLFREEKKFFKPGDKGCRMGFGEYAG